MEAVIPGFVVPNQRQDTRKDNELRSLRGLLTRKNVDKPKVNEIARKLIGGNIGTDAVTVFSLRGLCDLFHEGDPATCDRVLSWFYDLQIDEDTAKLILGQPDKKRKRVVIYGRGLAGQRASQRGFLGGNHIVGGDSYCI